LKRGVGELVYFLEVNPGSAGGLTEFDISGNIRKDSLCEPLKGTEKEAWNGTLRKITPNKLECK